MGWFSMKYKQKKLLAFITTVVVFLPFCLFVGNPALAETAKNIIDNKK